MAAPPVGSGCSRCPAPAARNALTLALALTLAASSIGSAAAEKATVLAAEKATVLAEKATVLALAAASAARKVMAPAAGWFATQTFASSPWRTSASAAAHSHLPWCHLLNVSSTTAQSLHCPMLWWSLQSAMGQVGVRRRDSGPGGRGGAPSIERRYLSS